MVLPGIAQATPSEDDIARAKAAEEAARLSVAQIEVALANATAAADTALVEAQKAAEEYNGALYALEQATKAADKAQSEADAAQSAFEVSRQKIASIAQTAYREGGASLDSLSPYVSADGLRDVETRRSTLKSFSVNADDKMQEVAALEQVAKVMQAAAAKARDLQAKATAESEARADEARAAADAAVEQKAATEIQREALVTELAKRQNTTVALVKEREAFLEAERRRAAEEAARKAAEAERLRLEEEARQRAAEEARRRQEQAEAQAQGGDDGDDDGYEEPAPSSPAPAPAPAGNANAVQGAIDFAYSVLGSPYVWGGEGPGYDCSGLVTVAYRTQGIYLPHWSVAQYDSGTKVPVDAAIPGDLIFWGEGGTPYHVAIYLGDGQIIEAPTFGVPVRVTGIYNWGSVMPYAVRVA
ncbi:C40 family peptidase [Schaalia sp. 19OD2882]|nr:C40 family peptidase [Schaalia sp. 19OD2882]